eukprot:CAMPEP_0178910508 /NCGR_PEP_ID=MMETSP0786-20121207/9134_1 /TAXON_ID=186022 /ORGANISM="Thalassionema frauenfeldii, Strain CCMP 1798" /LENGTH=326 /DNA_ID=CAMNT_0020582763 /DNA_START=54 /DNA_END=1037 /DNA_ORIENTATION=+
MGMDNGDKLDSHTLIVENEKLQRDLQEMRKRVICLEQQQQQLHRANVGSSKNQIQTCDSDAATLDKRDTQGGKIEKLNASEKMKTASKDVTNREIETEDIESGQPSRQEIVSLLPDDNSAGAPLHHGKNDIGDEDAGDANRSYSFGRMVMDRAGWLVGLLVLQSMSSFIIQRNEIMLQKHLVIVRFLTMLVGAGGNAGNQASVRVIRGLAVGTIRADSASPFLLNEFSVGLFLSIILGVAGCLRAAVFLTPLLETIAITTSLVAIVLVSVILGATLPLGMKMVGIDPAHSSTTIQVLMDILGVTITVCVSGAILDSGVSAVHNNED